MFIGSANICIHSSEQLNSLTSEIHFLRKQNQRLNAMLVKGSQGKIRQLDAKGTKFGEGLSFELGQKMRGRYFCYGPNQHASDDLFVTLLLGITAAAAFNRFLSESILILISFTTTSWLCGNFLVSGTTAVLQKCIEKLYTSVEWVNSAPLCSIP